LSLSSYYNELKLLRKFFAWLLAQGEIPLNPLRGVRNPGPTVPSHVSAYLPGEEFQLLVAARRSLYLPLLLLLDCGLSMRMVTGLEWRNFDLANCLIFLYYPVSKLHLILPLSSRLLEALRCRVARAEKLHLHFRAKLHAEKLFSPCAISDALVELARRLPFPFSLYRLRATFAKHLLDASGDAPLVEYCTGSAAWKHHRFNCHLPPSLDRLREIFARMERTREEALEKFQPLPIQP
jgi:integrase